MSEIHHKIVQEIIKEESVKPEIVAINLFGSVASGNEKPGSDIDIQIVTSTPGVWFMENQKREGIEIDFELCSLDKLKDRVKKYPFLCYIYLSSKIVYDSDGQMKKILDEIKNYFNHHPEVLDFWNEKQIIKKELKKQGLAEGFSVKCHDEAERLFSKEHKVTRDFFRGK